MNCPYIIEYKNQFIGSGSEYRRISSACFFGIWQVFLFQYFLLLLLEIRKTLVTVFQILYLTCKTGDSVHAVRAQTR